MIEINIVKISNGKRYRLTSFSVPETTFEQKAATALDSVPESKPGAGTDKAEETKTEIAMRMLKEGKKWNEIISMGISRGIVQIAARELKKL